MSPSVIIAMATASLAFLRWAIPEIESLVKKGEVSKEEQEQVLADYKSLRERADGQFKGPEWNPSNR